MRRRTSTEPQLETGDSTAKSEAEDRQFITALSRGLDVLKCFCPDEAPLVNQEISRRTGLPRPTVSRIIYTLRELGYLRYYYKSRSCALGGAAYVLGQVADANFDPLGASRPIMQRYAKVTGANFGLSARNRQEMTYVVACEGAQLIGLQLRPGDRIPMARSAIGLAYLATVDERERSTIMRQLHKNELGDLDEIGRRIAEFKAQIEERGFCLSLGEWQPEIHGVTVPIKVPRLDGIYVLSAGGPAERLPRDKLLSETGPLLLQAASELRDALGARRISR